MATIGERIKTLRIASNLNQEEFGKQFGLVKSTVSLYENGKSTPDDETKKKICEKYNVSMDWLYGLTVDSLLGTERSEENFDHTIAIMKFGEILRSLRLERNITQKDLAKRLSISPSTVGMYEQNRRFPDADILVKLSSIFDVSVDYLLGIERSEKQEGIRMNLRKLREKAGLSQAELGNLVGLKQTTISQYESGAREPNLDLTQKIADVLDVSLDELVRPLPLQVESNEKEDLGQTIANLRKQNNLTQAELGAKLGVIKQTISSWENGVSSPSNETLANIASIFDVSVDYLLGLEDARSKKLQVEESKKEDLQKIITDLCQITQNLKAWIEKNL